MGRTTTNSLQLSASVEASPGVLAGSPTWDQMEPNAITSWGAATEKVMRTPISKSRSRRKGTVTTRESPVEFEADATLSMLRTYLEGFAYARAVGPDAYRPTAATSGGYTVAALSAAQAGRFTWGTTAAKSLVYARGHTTAANNGIKPISAQPATSAVLIPVAGNTAETYASNQDVEVAICGVRGAAGDLKINAQGNLTSTALNFTTLGLYPGQIIHVGGLAVANQFFNTANLGFARIVSIAANLIVLDRKVTTFVTDDGTSTGSGGSALSIDILFGQFIRNVEVGHADYLERTYQFELQLPNLGTGGADRYEYAIANYCDALSIEVPLTDKATLSLGFVGTDTGIPTATRASGAVNARVPNSTAAYGTSTDIARLRLMDVDTTGLTTDFKTITLTLVNNASGEKVLGQPTNKYVNQGIFEIDIEAQALFTNPDVVERIRCNKTVGFDFGIQNDDGGVMFDFPSGTLDGGDREFPVNESVLFNSTFMAFKDPTFGHQFSASFFPVLPARACA